MTQPTPQEIAFATGALATEADLWEQQSHRLSAVAHLVALLRLPEYGETVLFDGFLAAYEELTLAFIRHCAHGSLATAEVGLALRAVGETYAGEEAANLHAIHNLY
jgi:hypothetical protein